MASPFSSSLVAILSLIPSILTLYPLISVLSGARATHLVARANATSAWNGHPDNKGSDKYSKSNFTPYYVPTGSVSLDDADPLVHYTPDGAWAKARHPDLVDRSMHTASMTGAKAEFVFVGIGVEWFGSVSAKHGIAEVYLNDTLNAKVDAYHATWLKRQRLFGIDHLPFGSHRLSIVNTGKKRTKSEGTFIDVDAFVLNPGDPVGTIPSSKRQLDLLGSLLDPSLSKETVQSPQNLVAAAIPGPGWSLAQAGQTGVHAMQLSVISATHAIVIDKVEHNPLTINGHPAWGALYDLRTNQLRPLNMRSNSFCAGGTFLSNGSLINVGGNPVVVDNTGAADFGDVDGLQAVRLFHPDLCDDQGAGCDIVEAPHKLRMASPRWYNTVLRLDDGSAMIMGGSTRGGWINNATTNNPTIEYYPPKNINGYNGLPVPSQFLAETLNSNLFPIAFLLPDGRIFVAANRDAMIYDWKANTEQRLPQIPNGVRVTYPMTGTAVLLPLSSENNFLSTILICGGSTIDDTRAGYEIDSQESASSQCVRMDLTGDGIQRGWEVEQMPQARIMPDSVLLPTGDVMILNGGGTGIAGYGNVKDQTGYSNADHPIFTPVLYRPSEQSGSRFKVDSMPVSEIARLYHSVATLVPDGRIMIAGSNPNLDRSTAQYATEYRVEWLKPSWLDDDNSRPTANISTISLPYGSAFTMSVDIKGGDSSQIKISLMDLGFVTHSLHMNGRLVHLDFASSGGGASPLTLRAQAPPNSSVYPPGPAWVYVVVGDKWTIAFKVMVGDGSNPPEDPGALQNMLSNSNMDSGKAVSGTAKAANPSEAILQLLDHFCDFIYNSLYHPDIVAEFTLL